jgi:hypothetical protein
MRSKAKRMCKVLERITYDELPKVRSEVEFGQQCDLLPWVERNVFCPASRAKVHCLTKIFLGDFSTYEVLPLPRFSTSAKTPPGTTNAKNLGPPRQKPTHGASYEAEEDSW